MGYNIYERLSSVSYSNGKFLSDKSYAYDTVYFISKFIKDYSSNNVFDFAKWKLTLIDYISEKWQLLNKNDGLINYYHETINLLEYANVVCKERNYIRIIDYDLLNYITNNRKMENAYIFVYLLCYFTIKNSGCYDYYLAFCNTNLDTEKRRYITYIYNRLSQLNVSIRNKDIQDQWSKQNTQYIINVLNFINHEPWVTREFTFDKNKTYSPEMISVNIKGTKTRYPKKNAYLDYFDFDYVIENLNNYIVKRS